MSYEVLKRTPISGYFEERHFGATNSNPLWIKFNLNGIDCWIGSFAGGDLGIVNQKIFETDKIAKTGILTNGAFYLIDKDSKDLIFHPENGVFVDFQIIHDKNFIFLATNGWIFIIQDNKCIKELCPEFIDGIRFSKMIDNLLLGEIYEPGLEWTDFEIDLQTLKTKWKEYEF